MVYLNALSGTNEKYIPSGALYFKIDDPVYKTLSKATDDEVNKNIISALKMKGILLDDDEVIKNTDPITATRQKKASLNQFMAMDKHLKKVIRKICSEMSDGKININPSVKNGYAPCDYCEYHSICNIDMLCTYEYFPNIKDEEVWAMLGGENNVD